MAFLRPFLQSRAAEGALGSEKLPDLCLSFRVGAGIYKLGESTSNDVLYIRRANYRHTVLSVRTKLVLSNHPVIGNSKSSGKKHTRWSRASGDASRRNCRRKFAIPPERIRQLHLPSACDTPARITDHEPQRSPRTAPAMSPRSAD